MIKSKVTSNEYREGWDRIWGEKIKNENNKKEEDEKIVNFLKKYNGSLANDIRKNKNEVDKKEVDKKVIDFSNNEIFTDEGWDGIWKI